MFDRLGKVATRGLQLAVKVATSPSTQAAAKQYALQMGAAVTAVAVRKAADMVEGKIEELEDRGSLSPKTAAAAAGVVRATSTGVTVTAAVVGNAAGTVIGANELVRFVETVRDAIRNPATTPQPALENAANDPPKPELRDTATPGQVSTPAALPAADGDAVVKPKEAAH
jgi:hypothetical protein